MLKTMSVLILISFAAFNIVLADTWDSSKYVEGIETENLSLEELFDAIVKKAEQLNGPKSPRAQLTQKQWTDTIVDSDDPQDYINWAIFLNEKLERCKRRLKNAEVLYGKMIDPESPLTDVDRMATERLLRLARRQFDLEWPASKLKTGIDAMYLQVYILEQMGLPWDADVKEGFILTALQHDVNARNAHKIISSVEEAFTKHALARGIIER